jgi:uncharacterized protein
VESDELTQTIRGMQEKGLMETSEQEGTMGAGQLGQETGGTFQAELQHLLADDDDHVVGIQRSTADRDGKHLDVGNSIVFQLKDGRITDGREHFHDLYAWDEFWS